MKTGSSGEQPKQVLGYQGNPKGQETPVIHEKLSEKFTVAGNALRKTDVRGSSSSRYVGQPNPTFSKIHATAIESDQTSLQQDVAQTSKKSIVREAILKFSEQKSTGPPALVKNPSKVKNPAPKRGTKDEKTLKVLKKEEKSAPNPSEVRKGGDPKLKTPKEDEYTPKTSEEGGDPEISEELPEIAPKSKETPKKVEKGGALGPENTPKNPSDTRPLKNAFTALKYKKPTEQEKSPTAAKKPKRKPTKNPPPLRKPNTQQTIEKMLQANQTKTKPPAPTPEKPPILKPAKLLCNQKEESNSEQNQTLNNIKIKPDMNEKPEHLQSKTHCTTQETKPVNIKPKQDTKRKPNHDLTTKPKPAQIPGQSRKVKTAGLPISDLKTFLEKKRRERELKQTLKLNLENHSPSNSSDSATISRPQDSLLMNAPTDEKSDNSEVIFERDQGSSAHNGEIQTMSGDLLLAQCSINLGEKPMM